MPSTVKTWGLSVARYGNMHLPVIPSTKEVKQEELKFSASMDCIDPVSKTKKSIFVAEMDIVINS